MPGHVNEKSEKDKVELLQLKNIDTADGLLRVGGNPEFYKKLLKSYKKKFGKPDEFTGDAFGIVLSWKWRFEDKDKNKDKDKEDKENRGNKEKNSKNKSI